MSSEEDVVCALALLYAYKNHTKARKKKWWVRPSLQSRKVANGSKLLNELREDDELNFELRGSFHNFLRMSSSDFENILCKIEPIIKKSDTFMRQAIPVQERLAVTLRFLATGDSYMSLSYLFKISKQSISEIIPEVCTAIIDVLKEFIKNTTINQEDMWKKSWKDENVVNSSLINDPTQRVPGFELPRAIWSALNRIRTEQGKCKFLLHKWKMTDSPLFTNSTTDATEQRKTRDVTTKMRTVWKSATQNYMVLHHYDECTEWADGRRPTDASVG
ncbi:hypothetical protein QTP88_020357 [Uroleucon formosanum]